MLALQMFFWNRGTHLKTIWKDICEQRVFFFVSESQELIKNRTQVSTYWFSQIRNEFCENNPLLTLKIYFFNLNIDWKMLKIYEKYTKKCFWYCLKIFQSSEILLGALRAQIVMKTCFFCKKTLSRVSLQTCNVRKKTDSMIVI